MSEKRNPMRELAERALGDIARGGRPRIFEEPEEMAEAILEYLDWVRENDEPITLTGMCLYIGMTRETLYRYQERPRFSDICKNARDIVTTSYERRLDRDKCAGAIFALKNVAGWTDRQTVTSTSIVNRIDWSRVSDEQLRRVKAGEPAIAVLGSGIKDLLLPEPTEGQTVEEADYEVVEESGEPGGPAA